MHHVDDNQKLKFIQKQFLCNVPVKEICWQIFSNLTINLQDQIINNTVRLDSVLKYPINLNYQKAFLKHLLRHVEKQNSVISDCLYEEYARLVALPDININFKHYSLEKGNKNIILKEDVHLISEGTTGLRTWQAAVALSEWILANTHHFASKTVIELGSGTGLTGLVIALTCKAQAVYLSDCHHSVLSTLCENVHLNIGNEITDNWDLQQRFMVKKHVGPCAVHVLNLPWEDVLPSFCQTLGEVNIVVAADVVYDKSIFKPLISAVDSLFKYCGVQQFILSCTERNEETLEQFLGLLGQKFKICNIKVPLQRIFIWAAEPPVKIFNVTACDFS